MVAPPVVHGLCPAWGHSPAHTDLCVPTWWPRLALCAPSRPCPAPPRPVHPQAAMCSPTPPHLAVCAPTRPIRPHPTHHSPTRASVTAPPALCGPTRPRTAWSGPYSPHPPCGPSTTPCGPDWPHTTPHHHTWPRPRFARPGPPHPQPALCGPAPPRLALCAPTNPIRPRTTPHSPTRAPVMPPSALCVPTQYAIRPHTALPGPNAPRPPCVARCRPVSCVALRRPNRPPAPLLLCGGVAMQWSASVVCDVQCASCVQRSGVVPSAMAASLSWPSPVLPSCRCIWKTQLGRKPSRKTSAGLSTQLKKSRWAIARLPGQCPGNAWHCTCAPKSIGRWGRLLTRAARALHSRREGL